MIVYLKLLKVNSKCDFYYIFKSDKSDKIRMIYNKFYFVFSMNTKKNNVKSFLNYCGLFKYVKKINFLSQKKIKKNFYHTSKNKIILKIFVITFKQKFDFDSFLKDEIKNLITKVDFNKQEKEEFNRLLTNKTN